MLDRDLAKPYGVETKYLNRQVVGIWKDPPGFLKQINPERISRNTNVPNWHLRAR